MFCSGLPGSGQTPSVLLMPQHPWFGFTNRSPGVPQETICSTLAKHRLPIPELYPQVSSHPQCLGSLSTYLGRLHLYLFQSESGEQTEPLQRKPEHESLRCFPTIFSLLILAEDELFRVSEPFMPTQVLKKRHFPLWLIDQLTTSPALSLWARSGESASFYLSSFRDINQLPGWLCSARKAPEPLRTGGSCGRGWRGKQLPAERNTHRRP